MAILLMCVSRNTRCIDFPQVDGYSTDPRVSGCHRLVSVSHPDSRSDPNGGFEPVSGRETIYWDSLPVFFSDIGGPKSYN